MTSVGPVNWWPRRLILRDDVNETLLFLLLGLGTGATIAAIAVGIVVTYRGLQVHQPGRGRNPRHARGLFVLGAPDR